MARFSATLCLGLVLCLVLGLLTPTTDCWAQPTIAETVIREVEESNPQTPLQLCRAVRNLINVRAYEAANGYLDKFLKAKPDTQALVEVHQEMGSAFFVRLLRERDVHPLALQATEMVMKAVDPRDRQGVEIQKTIRQAMSDDLDERTTAKSELRQIGVSVIAPLYATLKTDLKPIERIRARQAMFSLGPSAVPAFIGSLTSAEPADIYYAVSALEQNPDETALPFLMRPYLDPQLDASIQKTAGNAITAIRGEQPTMSQASKIIRDRVNELLLDPLAMKADSRNQSVVWTWDSENKSPLVRTMDRGEAAFLYATILADDLVRFAPNDSEHQRLYWLTQLGWAKIRGGIDQPLNRQRFQSDQGTFQADPATIIQVLKHALDNDLLPVAVAAAELLGEVGHVGLLDSSGGEPSILASALRYPDLRVRMAAAESILKINPLEPFAGAADLTRTLAFASSARGTRNLLIVHPAEDQATRIGGLFSGMGFRVRPARNGKEAMTAVRTDPDIEIVLLSAAVEQPRYSELAQQLVHDPLSAHTPLCIIARSHRMLRALDLAQKLRQIETYPVPTDRESAAALLQSITPIISPYPTAPAERVRMARRALVLLAKIIGGGSRYSFYEWLPYEQEIIGAIEFPTLARPAAATLGRMATPKAQTALLDFASNPNHPANAREQAVAALRRAIERTGVQLTGGQVAEQFDRYNASLDKADKQTLTILSSLLDVLEKRVDR